MREHLAHAAIHDPLTDLPNRDLFADRLEMALRRARRSGHRVAVMFFDLDRFKMVNDNLGHEVGDRLLRAVADRMSGALRASDTLARFGGDEFTVLCDEVADESHVLEIADRLRSTMGEPLTEAGGETFVSFSIGIALSTEADESGSTLLRHADIAMYRAKERGPAAAWRYTATRTTISTGVVSARPTSSVTLWPATSWSSTTSPTSTSTLGPWWGWRLWSGGVIPPADCSCPRSSSPRPRTAA